MLSQVELDTVPDHQRAVEDFARPRVTFSALVSLTPEAGPLLLRESAAKRLTSRDGTFISRALFPFDKPAGWSSTSYASSLTPWRKRNPSTRYDREHCGELGAVTITVGTAAHELSQGDALLLSPMWRTPITTAATTMSDVLGDDLPGDVWMKFREDTRARRSWVRQ